MIRFLKRAIGSEKGQALPIVLALLVLGGLTIAPSLNYAATILNHSRLIERDVNGIYAADAGVEYALWSLTDNTSPPAQLADIINRMDVSIQTEDKGTYTVYFGELIQAGSHSQNLSVGGDMVWETGNTYKYTITVTRMGGSTTIHLTEVGARLPLGYSYKPGSAADFPGNLSMAEPDEVQDVAGAWMVNWEFSTPYPSVSVSNPIKTQTFYVTGVGALEGDYAWVVANRSDIGEVGEMTGDLYLITSTATKDGKITARIVADVLMDGGTPYIVSWWVSK